MNNRPTYGVLKRVSAESGKQPSLLPSKVKRWRLERVPPHVAMQLKRVFPFIGKASKQPFYFQDTKRAAADLSWFLSRFPVLMRPFDKQYLYEMVRRFRSNQEAVEVIMKPDWRPPERLGWREGKGSRHYQKQPVAMMLHSTGVLCGDGVGLGKTFTGIESCLAPACLPAIIVCDRNLQKQWYNRIAENTHLRAKIINVTKPHALEPVDVYIFAWTQLAGWADFFSVLNPRLVVWDEVQDARTGTGTPVNPIQKGIAAKRLAEVATYRMGLSATPIYGYGEEMWNIMDIINPNVLGTKEEFREEWCSGRMVTDPDALGTYLRDQHAMVRRTKKDVSGQTPPVIRAVIPVDVDQRIMKEAEEEARGLAIQATTGEWSERGNAARQLDLRLRKKTGIAKAAFVADAIAAILESGVKKMLVACWHREVYAILMKRLAEYYPVMYTGSESPTQKQMSVLRFTQGESRLMFISLRSGRGLDGLQQYCSEVGIAELDWSGQVHDQFIGRVDREGQESYPVNAYFFVADQGSDPLMVAVNGIKRDQSDGITDPGVEREQVDYEEEESRIQLLIKAYSPSKAGGLL